MDLTSEYKEFIEDRKVFNEILKIQRQRIDVCHSDYISSLYNTKVNIEKVLLVDKDQDLALIGAYLINGDFFELDLLLHERKLKIVLPNNLFVLNLSKSISLTSLKGLYEVLMIEPIFLIQETK